MDEKQAADERAYIPGICNIGPAERLRRRHEALIATIVLLLGCIVVLKLDAPRMWRLVLFVPATAAAVGFLQDALHFCAGFGMKGRFNVAHDVGNTDAVTSAIFRRTDRRKAYIIVGIGLAVGAIVAFAATRLP